MSVMFQSITIIISKAKIIRPHLSTTYRMRLNKNDPDYFPVSFKEPFTT